MLGKQRIEVFITLGYTNCKRSMAEVCHIFNDIYSELAPMN